MGRWIYLSLLVLLTLWMLNLILGDMLFFRAEGFIMRTRQEAAAPFLAQVAELYVSEGQAQPLLTKVEVTSDSSLGATILGVLQWVHD